MMDELKPGELTNLQSADVLEKLIPEIECGLNIHFYELAVLHRAVDALRRPAPENKANETPRCDRCANCIHAPSQKADGFTHYCGLNGRDVGQSHFGHNSPRVCPLRTHENKPLTLEQLRQMDGERVWTQFRELGLYGLVAYHSDPDGDDGDDVYVTNNLGGRSTYEEVLNQGGTFYARKPEQEAHHENS